MITLALRISITRPDKDPATSKWQILVKIFYPKASSVFINRHS